MWFSCASSEKKSTFSPKKRWKNIIEINQKKQKNFLKKQKHKKHDGKKYERSFFLSQLLNEEKKIKNMLHKKQQFFFSLFSSHRLTEFFEKKNENICSDNVYFAVFLVSFCWKFANLLLLKSPFYYNLAYVTSDQKRKE